MKLNPKTTTKYNAVFNFGDDEREFEAQRNNVHHLCLEDHRSSINELENVGNRNQNEIDGKSDSAANNSERNHSEMNASSELALFLEFEDDNVDDDDFLYSGGLAVPVDNIHALEFRALFGDLLENHSEMNVSPEFDVHIQQLLENDSEINGNPPSAAKSFVENLPLVELTEEEIKAKNVACAICKIDIMLEEKVRRLPCSHCYHEDCIIPWLNMRNTCPVCQFELPTDDARGLFELAATQM